MAITIDQEPLSFQPVYNPLVYVADSDNTAEPNYTTVFDVYFDGSLQGGYKIPPRPGATEAVFFLQEAVMDSITHDIDIDTDGFATNDNTFKAVQVNVGEEYDVAGVKTVFPDLATSTEILVFNASLSHLDFIDYDKDDYLLVDSTEY